jgi:hypothetical protein
MLGSKVGAPEFEGKKEGLQRELFRGDKVLRVRISYMCESKLLRGDFNEFNLH